MVTFRSVRTPSTLRRSTWHASSVNLARLVWQLGTLRLATRHASSVIFSVSSSTTWSCQMDRFCVFSSTSRHFQMNFPRSHCARGLHMAGPFERFSIRNCMAVASVTSPVWPPRASISRTICPLAMPPMAGLHDIWAILFMSIVMRHVFAPSFAAAVAASHPA